MARQQRVAAPLTDDARIRQLLTAMFVVVSLAGGSLLYIVGHLKPARGVERGGARLWGMSATAPSRSDTGLLGLDATAPTRRGLGLLDQLTAVDSHRVAPQGNGGKGGRGTGEHLPGSPTRGSVSVPTTRANLNSDASAAVEPLEGHLSAILPGPGDAVRRPGVNMCLLAHSGKLPVLLKACGTYDRLFDRLKPGKEINRTIFRWDPETKQITMVGPKRSANANAECLTAPTKSGGIVSLAPCDRLNAADRQAWTFQPALSRHKRLGRLSTSVGCLRQPPARGHQPDPIVGPCDDTCSTIWTFDETPKSSPSRLSAEPPSRGPRVLCWILTYPKAHALKAVAINQTWGRRCDKLLFMTTEPFPGIETIVLDIGGEEDRGRLWNKSKAAWMHCYKNHLDSFDWFVKADDDTYIVYDHLVSLLRAHDASHDTLVPKSFGRKFNATRGQ